MISTTFSKMKKVGGSTLLAKRVEWVTGPGLTKEVVNTQVPGTTNQGSDPGDTHRHTCGSLSSLQS